MTTVPSIGSSLSAARIASTAASSAASLSPRPIHLDAAIAAASVTRTISRTRTRSRTDEADVSARLMNRETPCCVSRRIGGLVGFVHPMLEQVGTHPDGAGTDPGFHQEHRKAGADRGHGSDEQQGNDRCEMGPRQGRGEEQGDKDAGQDRGKDRQEDGPAHQAHPTVEDLQFADPPVVLRAPAAEQARLDVARPVDDSRKPGGEHVQERADATQQENWGYGQPDDLRDRQYGKARRGFKHLRVLWRTLAGTSRLARGQEAPGHSVSDQEPNYDGDGYERSTALQMPATAGVQHDADHKDREDERNERAHSGFRDSHSHALRPTNSTELTRHAGSRSGP